MLSISFRVNEYIFLLVFNYSISGKHMCINTCQILIIHVYIESCSVIARYYKKLLLFRKVEKIAF